jgi:hypothetical protein
LLPIFDRTEPPKIIGPGITPLSSHQPEVKKAHPEEHVSHRPATPRISDRNAIATPSISGALNESSSIKDQGSASPHPLVGGPAGPFRRVQPFSSEDLIRIWEKFVGKIEAPQLKSALAIREPVMKEEWVIAYELDNELQLQRLSMELKPKLLGYLRRHLNNDAIDVKFSVIPHIDTDSAVPYTDSEKWQALVEKYPALAKLKAKFGLDFE